MSRPGWLTYSRRFTHINSHPSAAGRAQDSESSPVKRPTFYHCATQPTGPVCNVTVFVPADAGVCRCLRIAVTVTVYNAKMGIRIYPDFDNGYCNVKLKRF